MRSRSSNTKAAIGGESYSVPVYARRRIRRERSSLPRDGRPLVDPLRECIDFRSSVARGATISDPLLHRRHQLVGERTLALEQQHVRVLGIIDAIEREIGLAAILDRLAIRRIQAQRFVVRLQRLVVLAEL